MLIFERASVRVALIAPCTAFVYAFKQAPRRASLVEWRFGLGYQHRRHRSIESTLVRRIKA